VTSATPHGVLVVDKPGGPTSHDVVREARKLFGTREVGHAGTLDPMATGVLILLFGEATKLSAHLTLHDKSYRAMVSFGRATDTLDAEGNVTEERAIAPGEITRERLEHALAVERARSEQQPPLFSAISVEGRRAHRIGRSGESVTLPVRPVKVHELSLLESESASATVELRVSKGYYVRAFARDLGAELGVPAHLASLRRLASGPFGLDEAVTWPPAEPAGLLPIATAAARALPSAVLGPEGATRARQGRVLEAGDFVRAPDACTGPSAWLGPDGELVALGEEREPGRYHVVRGFQISAR